MRNLAIDLSRGRRSDVESIVGYDARYRRTCTLRFPCRIALLTAASSFSSESAFLSFRRYLTTFSDPWMAAQSNAVANRWCSCKVRTREQIFACPQSSAGGRGTLACPHCRIGSTRKRQRTPAAMLHSLSAVIVVSQNSASMQTTSYSTGVRLHTRILARQQTNEKRQDVHSHHECPSRNVGHGEIRRDVLEQQSNMVVRSACISHADTVLRGGARPPVFARRARKRHVRRLVGAPPLHRDRIDLL